MLPAVLLVLLREGGVAQAPFCVVRVEQVLGEGAAFPQLDARVGVDQRRHPAVRRDAYERFLGADVGVGVGKRAHFEGEVEFVQEYCITTFQGLGDSAPWGGLVLEGGAWEEGGNEGRGRTAS